MQCSWVGACWLSLQCEYIIRAHYFCHCSCNFTQVRLEGCTFSSDSLPKLVSHDFGIQEAAFFSDPQSASASVCASYTNTRGCKGGALPLEEAGPNFLNSSNPWLEEVEQVSFLIVCEDDPNMHEQFWVFVFLIPSQHSSGSNFVVNYSLTVTLQLQIYYFVFAADPVSMVVIFSAL